MSDIGKFESEARLKAIEDAIGKVDDLLGGAGTTRGRLLRIKENRKFQSEPHKSKASQVCR